MGKVEIAARLRELNPFARADQIALYADALADYQLAQANIDEHGPVVFHPRTGSPIDNPYLGIRAKAARTIEGSKLDTDPLWPGVPAPRTR